jgi:hypothetical protein
MTRLSLLAAAALMAVSAPVIADNHDAVVVDNNITLAEVEAAQQAWCAALVQIARDFESGGRDRATATAAAVLDAAYGYGHGAVLFKPTLTSGDQTFRTTREGALAYFVGGNPAFPRDSGFALKGWRDCAIANAGVYINGDLAITMGNVILTNDKGEQTKVDKTWGFNKDDEGKLRIVLHHSSLPYTP